jgi:hypothetical protein
MLCQASAGYQVSDRTGPRQHRGLGDEPAVTAPPHALIAHGDDGPRAALTQHAVQRRPELGGAGVSRVRAKCCHRPRTSTTADPRSAGVAHRAALPTRRSRDRAATSLGSRGLRQGWCGNRRTSTSASTPTPTGSAPSNCVHPSVTDRQQRSAIARVAPLSRGCGWPWLFRHVAVVPRRRGCRGWCLPAQRRRSPGPGGWARCCRRPMMAASGQLSVTVRFLRSGRSVCPTAW